MGPNPTAVIIATLAVVILIVAVKGTQDNWVAAILGHDPSWSDNGPPASAIEPGSHLLPGGGGTVGPINPVSNIGTDPNGRIIATGPDNGSSTPPPNPALGQIFNPAAGR